MKPNSIFLSLICCTAILCSTSQVKAQAPIPQLESDQVIFSFWGGYSFNSIKLFGKTPDSQTTILGIGIKKKLRDFPNGDQLFYSADIIPYVQYHYPKRDENWKRTIVSGWGLSPVGFYLIRPFNQYYNPFIQVTGGVIYMDRIFPTDYARRLNFTFDITFGTRIKTFGKNMITLGYKFHHISNAETGRHNPGLDSNFLFLSLAF